MPKSSFLVALLVTGSALLATRPALADDAVVTVGGPIAPDGEERHWSSPPPPPPETSLAREEDPGARSTVRFAAGPVGIGSKHGLGFGAGASVELGKGQLRFRVAGTWGRGDALGPRTEGSDGSLGVYQAELAMDPMRGSFRPLLGLGLGVLHAGRGEGRSGTAGIATARFGLDYILPITDVEARVGSQFTGGILGPADDELRDMRTFGLLDLHLTIGF